MASDEFGQGVNDVAVSHARELLCGTVKDFQDRYLEGDQHVKKTPERFAKTLYELTHGEPFDFTVFDNDGVNEMITVGPIPYVALCAHHIVPFMGKAWVAYIPAEHIVGLSKIPRAVINISKGIWAQEQLTQRIMDFLVSHLETPDVAVVMKGEHLCMTIRGVQVPGTITTTSAMQGVFLEKDNNARAEFLEFIR